MVYVDVFVAGVGKWYEFKCEETALIRDIIKENPNNFRVFGPDETMSNRLSHIFEADNRCWYLTKKKEDEYLSYDGRIMDSYLSEHTCEGWL